MLLKTKLILMYVTAVLAFSTCIPIHDHQSSKGYALPSRFPELRTCISTSLKFTGPEGSEINLDINFSDPQGSGQSGDIFSVKTTDGQISDDYVVKIIKSDKPSVISTYQDALDEHLLSQEFEGFFVETHFVDFFSIRSQDKLLESSVLVKKRIVGNTLADVMKNFARRKPFSSSEVGKVLENLEDFKTKLAKKMAKLAKERSVFMVDLHWKNVMFDGRDWHVVDGYRLTQKSQLVEYLETSQLASHAKEVSDAKNLDLRPEFFESYIEEELIKPTKLYYPQFWQ